MDNTNDSMATEPPPPSPPPQLAELIQTLDQASLLAKQLSATTTTNSDHHRLIIATLRSAQLSLSSFLSLHSHHPDNSVSSAGYGGADEPMIDGDGYDDGGGEEELISKDSSMEKMEEKMRESLYIQNKRPKRPLSPSSERRIEGRETVQVWSSFDSRQTRLRNLDLVYQFHG